MIQTMVSLHIYGFAVPDVVTAGPFKQNPPPAPKAPSPSMPFSPVPPCPPHGGSLNVPLNELDPSALQKLCDEFRNGVFRKAGKEEPPEAHIVSAASDALESLKAVLLDPSGECASFVSTEDNRIVSSAIINLESFLKSL